MKYRSCKYFTAMEEELRRKTIDWLGTTYSEGMYRLWKGGTAQGCWPANSKGLLNWTQNSQTQFSSGFVLVPEHSELSISAEALWLMLCSKPKVTYFIFQSSILYSLNPCQLSSPTFEFLTWCFTDTGFG